MEVANRHYEKFTSMERCKLVLSALNREDTKEAEHLYDTAPVNEYHARDLAFTDSLTVIMLLSGIFFQSCVQHYNLIQKAESCIESIFCWKPESGATKLENMEAIQNSEIAKLKALYQALREFCAEVGLDFEEVIGQIPIKESHMDVDHFLSSDISINDAYKNEMKELFLTGWGQR